MARTEEEALQAYEKAPAAIQFSLSEGRAVDFIMQLRSRFGLHVDVAGAVTHLIRDLLLGFYSPDIFAEELKKVVADDAVSAQIIEAMNKEVFLPLREEMRQGKGDDTSSRTEAEVKNTDLKPQPFKPVVYPIQKPANTEIPVAPKIVPIYSPLPASSTPSVPPSRVQPPPNLPGQMPEPARPVPPPPHIEVPAPVAAPRPTKEVSVPEQDQHTRIIHTMARDMEAVKSGVDPLRVAHPAPPSWAEAPTKPAPVTPPPPVVPPQPQASHSVPPVTPPVTPPAPVVHEAPHPQEALRTHLKQYGVDPYREPVE